MGVIDSILVYLSRTGSITPASRSALAAEEQDNQRDTKNHEEYFDGRYHAVPLIHQLSSIATRVLMLKPISPRTFLSARVRPGRHRFPVNSQRQVQRRPKPFVFSGRISPLTSKSLNYARKIRKSFRIGQHAQDIINVCRE